MAADPDDSAVGARAQLLTLGSLIGVAGQLDNALLIQTVRQTGAQMIMLDGFQSISDLFAESVAMRRLLDSRAKLA